MKTVDLIARIFSIIFIPLLLPTYAMAVALWGTYLDFAGLSTRLVVLAITFGLTAMLPLILIFILQKLGIVSDPGLNNRTERFIPVGGAILCYLGLAFYLFRINSPSWLTMFVVGTALAALIMLVVSTRWKISGHAAGVGGLCAFAFFICYRNFTIHNNEWLFIGSVIIAGIVCSARLILHRHTLAQVIAGFFNGAACITLTQLIITAE